MKRSKINKNNVNNMCKFHFDILQYAMSLKLGDCQLGKII